MLSEFFDTDVILYKRKALLEELEFLETRVINEAKTGWILGSPGTGKSVAAFSFGRMIVTKGWTCTWIGLHVDSHANYIRLQSD